MFLRLLHRMEAKTKSGSFLTEIHRSASPTTGFCLPFIHSSSCPLPVSVYLLSIAPLVHNKCLFFFYPKHPLSTTSVCLPFIHRSPCPLPVFVYLLSIDPIVRYQCLFTFFHSSLPVFVYLLSIAPLVRYQCLLIFYQ